MPTTLSHLHRPTWLMIAACLAVAGNATPAGAAGPSPLRFAEATSSSGVKSILNGAYTHAAAWGDANGDGKLDLYIGTFSHKVSPPKPSRLLLANGDGTFRSAGQAAIETPNSRVSGAVFADLDDDGDDDLVVTNNRRDDLTDVKHREPNHLYRNDGGTFVDISETSGIRTAERYSRAVGVLDYDNDDRLDLFVTADSLAGTGLRVSKLLRNDGALTFRDATAAAGLPTNLAGLGVAVGDVNGDGWPDLAMAGGVTASGSYNHVHMFVNQRDGTFRAAPRLTLWSTNDSKDSVAGVGFGDLNRDGRLDLVAGAHYGSSRKLAPKVYLNQGLDANANPRYTELTGAGLETYPWGRQPHVELQDFDNDGWPDLYTSVALNTTNGLLPLIYRHNGELTGGQPNFTAPTYSSIPYYGAGGPVADYDGDGKLDVYIESLKTSDVSQPYILLLRNTTPGSNKWLEVKVSAAGNRMGMGAKVKIYKAGELGQASGLLGFNEITTGNGYSSAGPATVHFGLGAEAAVDVEVTMPFGGPVFTRANVAANQFLTVTPSSEATPPTADLTAPEDGATITGTTTVTADASDDTGVAKVDFLVDGVVKGSDTSAPYSYSWDSTTSANGSRTLTARSYDHAGNVGTSTAVTVTVDNPVPAASIKFESASKAAVDPEATSLTIPAPAGTMGGNVMLASLSMRGSGTMKAAPAGWTLVREVATGTGSSGTVRLYSYVKVTGESEPASYTWNFTTTTAAAAILRYSGVDTGNPVDASAAQANTASSTNLVAPSITTTVPNAMLIGLFASPSSQVVNPPSGMTERVDVASAKGLENADEARPTAVATGTRTATAGSSRTSATQSIALRPTP